MRKRTIAAGALTGLSLAVISEPAATATQAELPASHSLVNVSSLRQLLEPIPDAVRLLEAIRAEDVLSVAQKIDSVPPISRSDKSDEPAKLQNPKLNSKRFRFINKRFRFQQRQLKSR